MSLAPKAVRPPLALICCLTAGVLWAPTAAARVTPIVPPANGAGNQYLETLPGPSGSQALGTSESQSSNSSGDALRGTAPNGTQPAAAGTAAGTSLSPSAIRALSRHGQAGALVRGLAPQSRATVPIAAAAAKPDSAASSVGRLVVGKDRSGLGIALPLILGAATLAAIAFALRRRRG